MRLNIKKYSLFFLGMLFLVTFSCKKKENISSCDNLAICYTEKPTDLYVELLISDNPTSDSVRIRLYKGNMDNGELYDDFYTMNKQEMYLLSVEQTYTATAEYVQSNKDTVLVISSDHLTQKVCYEGDLKCYDWDKILLLDLSLKF